MPHWVKKGHSWIRCLHGVQPIVRHMRPFFMVVRGIASGDDAGIRDHICVAFVRMRFAAA
jgi:hypothetical protein